ncbi:YggS family pyridoxal phosphate-dependent enzyme [Hyphomonas sp. NPDC076900]|uniref:YggS family pyridoxal phosphate-dependent enzyme n=1 Tax=unclassified Hyphomonas TaxID=2630699 RepID=UPI003D07B75D
MSDLSADGALIAANIETVKQRMAAACARVGRAPESVTLLPVTKTVPAERLRAAYAAGGLRRCGENKVQEAREKAEALADLGLSWSVIGHLQTNKAKYVARFADAFHALDSLKLAEALERRLEVEGRTLDVFIQVNTSGEESKFGLEPSAAPAFARALAPFERLKVRGLMTLAIFSAEEAAVRACFRRLRAVQAEIRDGVPDAQVDELSMGMSGDFEWAIEEGATLVRVGQAIFGPRPLPDEHYWPGLGGKREKETP